MLFEGSKEELQLWIEIKWRKKGEYAMNMLDSPWNVRLCSLCSCCFVFPAQTTVTATVTLSTEVGRAEQMIISDMF